MTDTAKYYTPEIEEFHVGFEYQESWGIGGINEEWVTTTFNASSSVANIVETVRVKYLDKKDIESLGWKHDYNDDGEESPNLHDQHGYSMGFSIDKQLTPLNTAFILHYFPDHYLIIDSIVNCGSGREQMLFRGTIKNKSELSKLMKQLGIT